jgi:lysophospholipase L1-like esterase
MSPRIAFATSLFSVCVAACGAEAPDETVGTSGAGGTSQAGGSGAGVAAGPSGTSGGGNAGASGVGGTTGNATGGAGAASGGGAGRSSGGGGNVGSAGAGSTVDAGVPGAGGEDAVGGDGSAGESAAGAGRGGTPGATLTSFELVVIGSSTAAGEGASDESRGWVSLLEDALDERVDIPFEVTNLAVSGYASAQLSPDSGSSGNIDDAIDEAPALILVALAGSNDLGAGVSEDTFLSRLRTIRETANDAGIPVFFLSTAPKDLSQSEREALSDWALAMHDALEPCWAPSDSAYSPCFIDVFEPLANDSLGIRSEYGAGDGIHLNDDGHVAVFEAAEPIVATYLCTVASCD